MEKQLKYTSVEELRKNLEIEPNVTKKNIELRFKEVAYNLLNNFVIRKSDTLFYRILEVECYFFSQNHQDLITYQRRAKAGEWFFHPSGVDLCFESQCHLTHDYKVEEFDDETHFGGILIRSLEKYDNGKISYIMGAPRLCCEELFNQFSAFDLKDINFEFPFIKHQPSTEKTIIRCCPRHFKFGVSNTEKCTRIKRDNWKENVCTVKESEFIDYLESNYRFYDLNGIARYDAWKPEQGKKRSYNGRPTENNLF